jgi:hypothetical protein
MPFEFDKEKTRKKIGLLLENIKTKVDPQLLDEYRSVFKKEVSLFHRSWVAAYLLMLDDQGGNPRSRSRNRSEENSGANRRRGNTGGEPRPARSAESAAKPPEPLPEEESRWLFISIGRNRRVFPREILGLIYAKASVSREDIGAIRILDNYSFVQARDTVADTIIEALNGKPFRGRTLTVNYARARREEDGEDALDSSLDEDRDDPAGAFEANEAAGEPETESEQGDNRPDEESV